MKTKQTSFTIKPFKNRNGAISFRVSGWLLGERIRKNFKTREDAILERGTLQLKQAQASSDLRVTSTFLTEPQLREAEAAFLKLKERSRLLTFYLDIGLETHREPKTNRCDQHLPRAMSRGRGAKGHLPAPDGRHSR